MTNLIPKRAIELSIEGGWKLIALPKRGIIRGWYYLRGLYRGIKENVLLRLEIAKVVDALADASSERSLSGSTYVTGTHTTSKSTGESLLIRKLNRTLKPLNLDGLANDLGITREGVTRLIWLLGDARDTNNGLERYSKETIIRVKNALYEERILKQTTTPLDFQPSWTKSELLLTKKQWRASVYGIQRMVERSVVNATAI